MRKIVYMALASFVAIAGCSKEYTANMDARKQIEWVRSTNQRMAASDVMVVISKILTPVETAYKTEKEIGVPTLSPDPEMKTRTHSDVVVVAMGSMRMMSGVFSKLVEWQGRAEMMRARAQAIQYLTPIIQSIYTQHYEEFGTPMSTNEVFAKLIGQVPLLATVGGMYALGEAGIKNAGDSIKMKDSTLKNRSSFASDGSAVGKSNQFPDSSTTQEVIPLIE